MHDVPARERLRRGVRGALQAQRAQYPLVQRFAPVLAAEAAHHGAQQAVGEVGVVETVQRGVCHLVRGQRGQEGLDVGTAVALPPVAVGLALHAAGVAEELAEGHGADRGAGQVAVEQVVEGQAAFVAQCEYQGGGHGFGN
jgi:hypothetical protein